MRATSQIFFVGQTLFLGVTIIVNPFDPMRVATEQLNQNRQN